MNPWFYESYDDFVSQVFSMKNFLTKTLNYRNASQLLFKFQRKPKWLEHHECSWLEHHENSSLVSTNRDNKNDLELPTCLWYEILKSEIKTLNS